MWFMMEVINRRQLTESSETIQNQQYLSQALSTTMVYTNVVVSVLKFCQTNWYTSFCLSQIVT